MKIYHPPLNPLPSREGKMMREILLSDKKTNKIPSPLVGEGQGGGVFLNQITK